MVKLCPLNATQAMKRCILFFAMILIFISSFANENQKKEKKYLIELIKSEYSSWSIKDDIKKPGSDLMELSSFNKPGEKFMSEAKSDEKSFKKNTSFKSMTIPHEFDDFEFNIVDDQAVVQFTVDQQPISAFLEKDNGKWKLICAAKLDHVM